MTDVSGSLVVVLAQLVDLLGADIARGDVRQLGPALLDRLRQLTGTIEALSLGRLQGRIPVSGRLGDSLKRLQGGLRQLVSQVEQVSKGDYSRRSLEMGDLSRAFQTLSAELQAARTLAEERARSLERLARVDPLSNTYNRRFFEENIEGELARARRYQRPLSLMLADVDHFKSINASFGNWIGDEVLRAVASALTDSLRAGIDWVARIGPDDFAAVLPETDGAGCKVAVGRIFQALRAADLRADGKSITASISAGAVSFNGGLDVPQAREALDVLNKRLYRAKSEGGSRCYFS
jgi:diguanylate cyclase (GGDEF)-like protein